MRRLKIDEAFLGTWSPRYDETEHDEDEYRSILATVAEDVSGIQTLSRRSFERIIEWKAARVKAIINWNEFDVYGHAFKACLESPDEQKLPILDALYGIGVPVASTVLHFMYPDRFPIMDIRTVEVLHQAGCIESTQRDQKHYMPFRSAILGIAQRSPGSSLREIDRSLFAYHKQRTRHRRHIHRSSGN